MALDIQRNLYFFDRIFILTKSLLIMGVCAQQHRISIGRYNGFQLKTGVNFNATNFNGGKSYHGCMSFMQLCIFTASVAGLILYVYMLCLMLAFLVDIARSELHGKTIPPFHYPSPNNYINTFLDALFDCVISYIVEIFACSLMPSIPIPIFPKPPSIFKINCMLKKYNKKYSTMCKISHMYTLWLVSINLFLIVFVNPAIVNPGPTSRAKEANLSVYFQNVRGLIPFTELGKPSPMLDNTKLFELQQYLFINNIDIVLLNETWLINDIKNNEIFPNNTYKTFRMDRSIITHPPDPNNPDKFRRNGGGVLIALRSDLAIKSKKIKIDVNAEVLALELSFSSGKKLCISTCYRVGTLEDKNHLEIDKYLRKIAENKKIGSHIVVGDFNLNKTQWPDGTSTNNLDTKFLNTFEDVGFTQMITESTHVNGNTLDLLLTDTPIVITNIKVLEHEQGCKSDHFAITFTLMHKVNKLKPVKRKVYNFTKANWNKLNSDLKHVNWSRLITDDITTLTSWNIFKDVLFKHCDKHIPKITIKSKFQYIHKICIKKERLRARFKNLKNPKTTKNLRIVVKTLKNYFKKK